METKFIRTDNTRLKGCIACLLQSRVLSVVFGCLLLTSFSTPTFSQSLCDPTIAPTGLSAVYTPGSGVLFSWDAVPGSVGARLRVFLPSGGVFNKNIVGTEPEMFFVPETALIEGTYIWQVALACSLMPVLSITPFSPLSSFDVTLSGGTCPTTVSDIDGNTYPVVTIGTTCWMQENLDVTHYNNGDLIPTGLSDAAWESTTTGARSVYLADASYRSEYGQFYNWFAVNDSRGICPVGWSVATASQWDDMASLFGGLPDAAGDLKTTGTLELGTGLWSAPNTAATNLSQYSAKPAGYRKNFGEYGFLSLSGIWWVGCQGTPTRSCGRRVYYNSNAVNVDLFLKNYGFSIRCIKNS